MNAQGLSKQKRNLIFTNIVISSIASTMLMTALTTALPAIVDEFHVGVAMGQWLTSGYSLVMGLMMPLTVKDNGGCHRGRSLCWHHKCRCRKINCKPWCGRTAPRCKAGLLMHGRRFTFAATGVLASV